MAQIGSTSHEKPNYGTIFPNPFFDIKNDFIKIALDARRFNSITDESAGLRPLETLAPQNARVYKVYKSSFHF